MRDAPGVHHLENSLFQTSHEGRAIRPGEGLKVCEQGSFLPCREPRSRRIESEARSRRDLGNFRHLMLIELHFVTLR
jgi:hypothetical protein